MDDDETTPAMNVFVTLIPYTLSLAKLVSLVMRSHIESTLKKEKQDVYSIPTARPGTPSGFFFFLIFFSFSPLPLLTFFRLALPSAPTTTSPRGSLLDVRDFFFLSLLSGSGAYATTATATGCTICCGTICCWGTKASCVGMGVYGTAAPDLWPIVNANPYTHHGRTHV